ncbi:MAG: 2-amino-4-hydroxy-6-hydroxymethyldihydropteridine diphosphokinase [Candidatus Acidiferrum sp.]
MPIVYLSLGSNLGDREANLRSAIEALAPADIDVKKVSSIYETEPVDYLDQPWFLNCVVEAETELDAHALLRALNSIESRLGSKKEFSKGPRKIDLDLLLYGSETIDTSDLQVPHARMAQRRFVLAPLVEIAPHARHPSWQGTAEELLSECSDRSSVRLLHKY